MDGIIQLKRSLNYEIKLIKNRSRYFIIIRKL